MRHPIDPRIDCVFKALPVWMQTEEMQQAMSTLTGFSEKEREYHVYQARQNYLRRQRSIQRRLDELEAAGEQARVAAEQARAAEKQARAAAECERAAKEQERAEKEAALAEIERLKWLLGVQPGKDSEDSGNNHTVCEHRRLPVRHLVRT